MSSARAVGTTAVCDPPGPAPRFGCQWSTDLCDWFCPVCDPFGSPPRSSCNWDGNLCNWICPGYTGVEVTVQTLQPPVRDATVYLRLSSLCTATGAAASCNGSFTVYPGMPVGLKCQAIVDAISNNCSPAGYAVTENNCRLAASLTASNLGCPATQFALGLSNDPALFDQTGQGPLPDGESDSITGTTGSCVPMPGPVGNLRLVTLSGGDDLQRYGAERDIQHRGGNGAERITRIDARDAAGNRVLSRRREQHLVRDRPQTLNMVRQGRRRRR